MLRYAGRNRVMTNRHPIMNSIGRLGESDALLRWRRGLLRVWDVFPGDAASQVCDLVEDALPGASFRPPSAAWRPTLYFGWRPIWASAAWRPILTE